MDRAHYYIELAAAYARGAFPDLASAGDEQVLSAARERGLRLHRFKRTAGLPRVRRVLGTLKGFAPKRLLDIGSGRGAFLWPLLDEIRDVQVAAVDLLEHRVADINTVRRGGVERVQAFVQGAESLPWADGHFDAVTILEVLEHVVDPAPVAAEVVRLAGRVAVATVPAKEDNNPEHVRLFTEASLRELFVAAGAKKVHVEYVLNHIVAVVTP